jgi:hypothetical protein
MNSTPPILLMILGMGLGAVFCFCLFLRLRILKQAGGKLNGMPWKTSAEVERVTGLLPTETKTRLMRLERIATFSWLGAAATTLVWYFRYR